MTTYIFDIDGTLADQTQRLRFISGETKDWDSFFDEEEMLKDKPIAPVWSMMETFLFSGHEVLFVTARPDRTRDATMKWLMDTSCEIRNEAAMHWFRHNPLDLYMRRNSDRRSSAEVKERSLRLIRETGANPTVAFEDRRSDANMWRHSGLICCHLAEGNF